MKRWMLQVLRMVITLVLMVSMAFMIFDQRERIGAAREEARVAKARIAAQEMQIEALTKEVESLRAQLPQPAADPAEASETAAPQKAE